MNKKIRMYSIVILSLTGAFSLGTTMLVPGWVGAHRPPPPPVHRSATVTVHHHYGPGRPGYRPPPPPPPPYHHHHDYAGSFVAGTVTGLAVGAIISAASMPPSCTTVAVNNVSYRRCGSNWYQPYYVGTELQFQLVNPPF